MRTAIIRIAALAFLRDNKTQNVNTALSSIIVYFEWPQGPNLIETSIPTNDYSMKDRMQNTSANANGCPQRDRTASEGYVGAQTYMEIVEGELVEMHFEGQGLMEQIIDIANLRAISVYLLLDLTHDVKQLYTSV